MAAPLSGRFLYRSPSLFPESPNIQKSEVRKSEVRKSESSGPSGGSRTSEDIREVPPTRIEPESEIIIFFQNLKNQDGPRFEPETLIVNARVIALRLPGT